MNTQPMKQTKFDVLSQRQQALEKGIAQRMIEILSELTNLRFVTNALCEFASKNVETIEEKDILNELKDYYLLSDTKVIHVPTNEFFNIKLVTHNFELQPQTEENSDTFSFSYKGIVTDEHSPLQKDHSFKAANEQHAWQLLREVLINALTGEK